MNEKNLFGDEIERGAFEADAGERASMPRTTRDAMTPVTSLTPVTVTSWLTTIVTTILI